MSWFTDIFKKKESKNPQPNCVWLAVLNAATWALYIKQDVRIAVYHVKPGEDHSQAEGYDKIWTPLTERWTGEHLETLKWVKHESVKDKEPYRYLTLREWVNEQMLIVEQSIKGKTS